MRSLIFVAVGGVAIAVGAQAALAFTFENQGSTTTQPSGTAQAAPQAGFAGMDPKSVLPPIGESISDKGFDFGPGAFNNGLASQPTRGSSVGPSWLYPPGH